MYGRLLINLFAMFLALPSAVAAGPAAACLELELASEVTVEGTLYRLRDVAHVGSGDCAGVGALELGKAPRPGYWAHITREQIAARLEREWSGSRRDLRWTGAKVVRVTAAGESFDGTALLKVAEQALRETLQPRYGRIELAAVNEPRDLILPIGRVELKAATQADTAPSKRMAVWIDIGIDGEHYRSIPVWYSVSAWASVISVNRDLEHHHRLEVADLSTVNMDVAGLGGLPVTDPEQLQGQRLVRPLQEGDVLLEKHFEPAPLVQRGTVVEVFAKSGRVVLRSKGVALSDGDLSERIVISNPKSGEHYAAVVVGQDHVEAL